MGGPDPQESTPWILPWPAVGPDFWENKRRLGGGGAVRVPIYVKYSNVVIVLLVVIS